MEKIDILTKIINKSENTKQEYNIIGIKEKNRITYKEEDTDVIINVKDDIIVLNRKNSDMEMSLELKKGKSKGYYKFLKNTLDIDINVKEITINEYDIYVEYDIYFDDFKNGEFIFELEIKK